MNGVSFCCYEQPDPHSAQGTIVASAATASQRHSHIAGERLWHLLVSIWANACGLVVFGAINVWAVVEGSVSSPNGSPSPLV